MSLVTVNDVGGHQLKLDIKQSESNQTRVMLKEPFIRDSENWTLQIEDFVVSTLPPLNDMDEVALEIRAYAGTDLADEYFGHHQFKPGKVATVVELFRKLQEFVTELNRLVFNYGLLADDFFAANTIKANFIAPIRKATTVRNELDVAAPNRVSEFLKVSITSDMKLVFEMHNAFFQNFYIVLSDDFSRYLGFPKQLFRVEDGANGHTTASAQNPIIFDDDTGNYIAASAAFVANRGVKTTPNHRFKSTNMLSNIDERLSIDILTTLPIARKKQVKDGVHQETYLLGRVELEKAKLIGLETVYTQPLSEPSTNLIEEITVGVDNLIKTDGYEINTLLGAPIQEIHAQLFVRYLQENGKVVTRPYDLEDGFFKIGLTFTKNV